MLHDDTEEGTREHFEIGYRFRRMIEARITRLEADASHDEDTANLLDNIDHVRRQMRLVAVQRKEALRMRRFLEHSTTRVAMPTNSK
jgi:uncharacterized coiled-coil protein SlyX